MCSALINIVSETALNNHIAISSSGGIKTSKLSSNSLFLFFLLSKWVALTYHTEAKKGM